MLTAISDISIRMQKDLANLTQRFDQFGNDFRRFIERRDPALFRELELRDQSQLEFLLVPEQVAHVFAEAIMFEPSKQNRNGGFSLQDLSNALVYNFARSSKNFSEGELLSEREPSLDQFLNLLKCIWLLDQIVQLPELQAQEQIPLSHWPSYVQHLREVRFLLPDC